MKQYISYALVLIFSAVTGFTLQREFMSSQQHDLPIVMPEQAASVIGTPRPEFSMIDIQNEVRNIKEWDGKVVLLNFWATWCPPCKKEIPAFMALHQEYKDKGFEVIGIAIDDDDAVKDYVDTMGIDYTIIAAELEATELARRYGNRVNALPFSVFIGRDGKIEFTKAGELTKENTEKIINRLL